MGKLLLNYAVDLVQVKSSRSSHSIGGSQHRQDFQGTQRRSIAGSPYNDPETSVPSPACFFFRRELKWSFPRIGEGGV